MSSADVLRASISNALIPLTILTIIFMYGFQINHINLRSRYREQQIYRTIERLQNSQIDKMAFFSIRITRSIFCLICFLFAHIVPHLHRDGTDGFYALWLMFYIFMVCMVVYSITDLQAYSSRLYSFDEYKEKIAVHFEAGLFSMQQPPSSDP